jgi:phage shock protein A
MTLRSRLALFFNIRTSAALNEVEDPREVLDYAVGQQRAQLRIVKRGLIEVAAARRQLERQADRMRTRVTRHEEQARQALRSSREDLARAALERKQSTLVEIRGVEEQLADLAREEDRLQRVDQQMSQRVERFRLHRTVVSARYSAAEAQVGVGEALAGIVGDEETELVLAIERSEEKVERLHARAIAIDALTDTGVLHAGIAADEDAIQRELDAIGSKEVVDAELEALKRSLESEDPSA